MTDPERDPANPEPEQPHPAPPGESEPGQSAADTAEPQPAQPADVELTEEPVADADPHGPGAHQTAPESAAGGDRVAELERALEAAELKAKEAEDARLRTLAEMENQRRRLARDREEARRTAASKIIEELLPALDNLQMGLQMAGNHPEAANVAKGFEFVVQQIESILATNGLEKIDPGPGEDFDPHKAEAVGQEASPEVEDGQVLRCQRAGYELNGRLLRAAMVVIAKSE